METRRFINPSQPQTLYIATFLLYASAVLSLLFASSFLFYFGVFPALLIILGKGLAGYGIANEKRWGYFLGVTAAGLTLVPVAILAATDGIGILFDPGILLRLVFPVALFVLLIHPMSREYQRIWFS